MVCYKHPVSSRLLVLFISSMLLSVPMNIACGQDSSQGFNRELALRYIQNRDSNALVITEKYIEYSLHQHQDSILADAYHLRGLALKSLEHNVNAIMAFLKEREIKIKINDNQGLAEANLSLGEGYRAIYDPVSAARYLSEALHLFQESGDESGIARTLNRQAAVNIDFNDPAGLDRGYPQLLESQKLAEKIGDYDLQVNNLIMTGAYFGYKDDYETALDNLFKAKELIAKAINQYHLSLVLKNIGTIYYKAGNAPKAVEYHRLAYDDALRSGIKVYQWLAAYGLGLAYSKMNEEDSAYKYQAIGLQARVEIIDEVRALQKAMMEEQFLKESYERNLEDRSRLRRWINAILCISLFSVILIFIHLFIRNNQLRKVNQVLTDRNRIIEEQKTELKSLNAQKDKIYSIIAHDLRNPFNSILGFSELLSGGIGHSSKTQILNLSQNQHNSAVKFYNLLENLLQWAQLQQGTISFNPQMLSLSEMADECIMTTHEAALRKNINLNPDVGDSLWVYADKTMLGSILRNLVSNAVKFTPDGGSVFLSAAPADDNKIEISVRDTGIGMDPEILSNLYRFEKTVPRRGTNGESSSGLGLRICKEFAEHNGGSIRVESEPGKGSLFIVSLPSQKQQ
ncbi:MAG: tetratricopeptide repeat-containing sensor histidine kinase [Bacteroidota bacterium]